MTDEKPASDQPDAAGPGLPLTWAVTLAFSAASLAGIIALTSDLAKTDSKLTEAVGQVVKIDRTTTRGVVANRALPPTDAAIRETVTPVVGTADSLRRADATLATLGEQVRALADVLAGARDPLVRTITTADHTDATVRRAVGPTGRIVDTLRAVDRRAAELGPALDRTERISRSIESKLHILSYPPR